MKQVTVSATVKTVWVFSDKRTQSEEYVMSTFTARYTRKTFATLRRSMIQGVPKFCYHYFYLWTWSFFPNYLKF